MDESIQLEGGPVRCSVPGGMVRTGATDSISQGLCSRFISWHIEHMWEETKQHCRSLRSIDRAIAESVSSHVYRLLDNLTEG